MDAKIDDFALSDSWAKLGSCNLDTCEIIEIIQVEICVFDMAKAFGIFWTCMKMAVDDRFR